MRDIVLEETFYLDFTTRAFATGIPTVLAGTPGLSVLEENNATPITTGVSVSVDRASVVGLNMATIVATAANGYESGKGYSVYISTGTVSGVSVVGEVVGQFTIDASAAAQDLANGTDGLGAIKTDTAAILIDTGIDIPARFDGIEGTTFATGTDSLEAIRDRGDAAWTTGAGGSNPFVLQNTTIATLASQTIFTLTAGSSDNNAYDNMLVVVEDSVTATQKAIGVVSNYVGSTKTITLREDPGVFTMAVGDTIDVLVVSPDILDILADTNELQSDDVPGLIAALNNFNPASDAVANVTLVATTTANTDMRGTDSAATATALATVDSNVDAILVDTGTTIPAQISGLNDVAATDIVSAGAITTLSGAIVNVDLVDTTTTNTDMRGTDSANTVAPDNAGIAAIQAKTDDLTFTKVNELDSNVKSVNGQTVTGDGGSGTEWQGA